MTAYSDIKMQMALCKDSQQAMNVILRAINALSSATGRNTVVFYSMGIFSGRTLLNLNDYSINEEDRFALAAVCRDLDPDKGLDLIINSTGGDIMAGIAIGDYLRDKFGRNIRVIVPQVALSMATALCFVGREILMGESSCLGMIDPQYAALSCLSVIRDYERCRNAPLSEADIINFEKYPPGAYTECVELTALMAETAERWLREAMMTDEVADDANSRIRSILALFLAHSSHLRHSQRVNALSARRAGLKIRNFDDGRQLSSLIFDIHDSIIIALRKELFPKLTLSQEGSRYSSILYTS